MVCHDNHATVQAGAGIVYDSVAQEEYYETENKAGALLTALRSGNNLENTPKK